jgi:hypothetical protein
VEVEIKPAASMLSAAAVPDGARGHVVEDSILPVVRIEPTKGWVSLRLGEIWTARGLLYFLVWRRFSSR